MRIFRIWMLSFLSIGCGILLTMPSSVESQSSSSLELGEDAGQPLIMEGGDPVLRYNFRSIDPPPGFLQKASESNRKYARSRSNYIHPLYGPGGTCLTKDWSFDHPHHRGIYWAWPEVEHGGELGDLHALQKVFARPSGEVRSERDGDWLQIEAENLWHWEDEEPVVRELVVIRVHAEGPEGRFVDLEFHFRALVDSLTLARRDTDKYGGLNVRLSSIENQLLEYRTLPDQQISWGQLSGQFDGSDEISGLSIFQNPGNPYFPGEWIEYPELNWLQPTFPATGSRFVLERDEDLVLRYRLWIHSGRQDLEAHREIAERYTDQIYLVKNRVE